MFRFFFFNDTATTEIYTLSLHDALPICAVALPADGRKPLHAQWLVWHHDDGARGKAGKAGKKMVLAGPGGAERATALGPQLVAREGYNHPCRPLPGGVPRSPSPRSPPPPFPPARPRAAHP